MKYRFIKKAVSILAAAALCVSPMTFTGTQPAFAAEVTEQTKEVSYITNSDDELKLLSKKADLIYEMSGRQVEVQPLKMKKTGFFYYEAATKNKKVKVALYQDQACKKKVSPIQTETGTGALVQAGTYYLRVESSESCKIEISMYEVPAVAPASIKIVDSERSDQSSEEPVFYLAKGKTAYIRVNIPAIGILDTNDDGVNSIACNAKKQPLEKSQKGMTTHYLSKGTYYLRLVGKGDIVNLYPDFASISAGKNTSKAKAQKIGAGDFEAGIIPLGKGNRVQWYQFTLKSDCKNDLYLAAEGRGMLTYQIYDGAVGIASGRLSNEDSIRITDTDAKKKIWKKGTYYIRISGKNPSSCGEYYIARGSYLQNLKIPKIPDQVYTGKIIQPPITVKDGKNKLYAGLDYTLSYSDNQKIGTAKVTIKAAADSEYKGSKTLKFKIVPNAVKIQKAQIKNGTLRLKWGKNNQADRYKIAYADNKSMKHAKKVTVKGKTNVSRTISGLNSQKTYYVRVRACKKVSGKIYNGKWSHVKKAVSR